MLGALLWRQAVSSSPVRGCRTGWSSAPSAALIQGVLLAYAVLWVVLTIDTLRLVRLVKTGTGARFGIARPRRRAPGGLRAAAPSTPSQLAGATRDTLGAIFGASGPSVPPSDGYYNILLLGADSGEGRDSMRFDSISVVSVNADDRRDDDHRHPARHAELPVLGRARCRTATRTATRVTPTRRCGWGSGINQLRTEVEVCQDGNALYPDAVANGSEPGIEATKDAAEGILGIEIPYYVFLDMHGFAALVDALGGVDITVEERLPEGGGPAYDGQPAEEWAIGLDRSRPAAHGRRHRAVVRPVALHDRRLRPDEAAASAAGGDPRAVHARRSC